MSVDFELRGCPIDKGQLLEVVTAYLNKRRPNVPGYSVCMECKRRGTTCVTVAHGTPCLGPGHAGRLRRDLPGIRARLLRLLRADGDSEHRVALEAAAGAGDERPGARARLPHVQRESARIRGGEHRHELATKTLRTDYLARVEGEGAMLVKIRDGKPVDVKLRIYEPPRFFEAFLRGRHFTEAPDITARICGICPVAYQTSSVNAMEDACGVEVGPQIRALRRLLYCGEWIESHALHVFMLHAPDFLGYASAIELAKDHRELVERALHMKKTGNEVMRVIGGREVHPINVKGRRLLPGAVEAGTRHARRRPRARPRIRARDRALHRRARVPRFRAGLRAGGARRSQMPTQWRTAGLCRIVAWTSRCRSTSSTSPRSTSSGRTRSTRT